MMPAAFGPVLPATSRVTVMLVYAEETPSDFVREVPEGTRYVGEKWSARAAPTSVPADHFASSAATRRINTVFPRAELTLPHGLGAGLVINCADCMDRDPLARANVRACGEPRVLGTPRRVSPSMPFTRTASHGAWPAACSRGTAISPPWG